ncbi:MAG: RecBCD enzyme subunit RecD [Paracidovorax wautersii]|uniref:RecBCD enzyme subunit RecD n=1 Tax=Paracidovorax wautersii TaxID=1177982 RepID=A0A7V8FM93_9BURK|nr:MAG: RecBCD enzyme subunit RecD [Paracidovorax wautersii]
MSRRKIAQLGQLDLLADAEAEVAAMPDRTQLLALLEQWAERGWLRRVDLVFARFLAEQDGQADAAVLLAAALASHQLGRGHVCLDLPATLADSRFALSLPPDGEAGEDLPRLPGDVIDALTLAGWQDTLRASALVETGPGNTPLVLAGERLYLRRYWQYEQDVLAGLRTRLAQAATLREQIAPADLARGLDALFPVAAAPGAVDWQRVACALMAVSAFGVVTGGPGTGKTTTVVKLLALLQSLALQGDGQGQGGRALRIRLAAPTGKAAARLNESIAGAVHTLALDGLPGGEAVREHIPREVTTLHRLLGSRPDTRRFRHDRHQPLPLDVLVIDEASMVDLEMMAAVLDALPPRARLLLLGDKDQLASVEAGAVLGSLCQRAEGGHYWPAVADWLAAVGAGVVPAALRDTHGQDADQAVAMLRRSYRFDAASGIGQLALAVNAGDATAARHVLAQAPADLQVATLSGEDDAALARLVVDGGAGGGLKGGAGRRGYRHYLETLRAQQPALDADQDALDDWARAVLAAYGEFQVLCALRRGPWGVEGLNARIAQVLAERGWITSTQGWYPGRPVLVTRNDYALGLMNGDIGVTLALPHRAADGERVWVNRVAFAAGDGSGRIRWVLPSRLQATETVYAMTVHKSQGSEFMHASLVLPDGLSPVLTRELVYTGITRARRWFTLVTAARKTGKADTLGVLAAALQRRVLRASGLSDGLAPPTSR